MRSLTPRAWDLGRRSTTPGHMEAWARDRVRKLRAVAAPRFDYPWSPEWVVHAGAVSLDPSGCVHTVRVSLASGRGPGEPPTMGESSAVERWRSVVAARWRCSRDVFCIAVDNERRRRLVPRKRRQAE